MIASVVVVIVIVIIVRSGRIDHHGERRLVNLIVVFECDPHSIQSRFGELDMKADCAGADVMILMVMVVLVSMSVMMPMVVIMLIVTDGMGVNIALEITADGDEVAALAEVGLQMCGRFAIAFDDKPERGATASVNRFDAVRFDFVLADALRLIDIRFKREPRPTFAFNVHIRCRNGLRHALGLEDVEQAVRAASGKLHVQIEAAVISQSRMLMGEPAEVFRDDDQVQLLLMDDIE